MCNHLVSSVGGREEGRKEGGREGGREGSRGEEGNGEVKHTPKN